MDTLIVCVENAAGNMWHLFEEGLTDVHDGSSPAQAMEVAMLRATHVAVAIGKLFFGRYRRIHAVAILGTLSPHSVQAPLRIPSTYGRLGAVAIDDNLRLTNNTTFATPQHVVSQAADCQVLLRTGETTRMVKMFA